MDERLLDIARALEATGWAAELYDARWRLVWCSSQLKQLVGEEDDEALGVGLHLLESRLQDVWSRIVPTRGMAGWIKETLPAILVDDPGIREFVLAHTDKREIRDTELDYKTGKLSDEDYRALDRTLRGEAIEILRRLDEVEGAR